MRASGFSLIGVIAAAAIVIGINMFADARLANVQLDLTAGQDLHAVARHAAGAGRPEGADHAAAVLLPPARQHGAGLRHLCRPRAGDAARIRLALGRQGAGWNSTIPNRSATPRTARWPTACRACRSTRAATQVYFGLAGTNLEDDERTIAVLPGRARALPGIRPDQAGLRAVEPEAAGRRRDVVAAARRRSARDDDEPAARAGGQPYASSVLLRQTNTVKTVPTRRAGDRPRHPGAAGGRRRRTCRTPRCMRSTSSSCAAAS